MCYTVVKIIERKKHDKSISEVIRNIECRMNNE